MLEYIAADGERCVSHRLRDGSYQIADPFRSYETSLDESDKADDINGISQTEIFTGHDR